MSRNSSHWLKNIVLFIMSTSTRHFPGPFEANDRKLRRLLRSVTTCMGDMSKSGCWWRSVSKRGSTAAAGDRSLERVRLSLCSWIGRTGGVNFGGRPRIWSAQTSFPPSGGENTWDVYRWMLDIFPTVRSNGFVFLNRNCLGSFLFGLGTLNVDLSDEVIDSFQHSIIS